MSKMICYIVVTNESGCEIVESFLFVFTKKTDEALSEDIINSVRLG